MPHLTARIRLRAALLTLLVLLTPSLAEATCMMLEDGCSMCCAPGGPCSTSCDEADGGGGVHVPPPGDLASPDDPAPPGPPGWYGLIGMGPGFTEPTGQLERALDRSFFSGRMVLGGGYQAWSFGLVLAGTSLRSDAVDLGWNDLWCQLVALGLGHDFASWRLDETARVGLQARVEGGWALLSNGDAYDHHGPSWGAGAALFYEDGDAHEPFRYRFWLDVGWSRPMLESATRDRHMKGGFIMTSVGFSGLVWGT